MQDFDVKNPYADNPVIEERRLRGARRVIAKHLLDSYQNKVHINMGRYVEVGKLRVYSKKIGKGSIVDHFLKAVALALKERPALNSTFDGEVHRLFQDVNIGYAITTNKGLITPVLRNADRLGLEDFYARRKGLTAKVMEWKQEMKDIMGGTFTITNLGNFGGDWLHPIINPPQVAILGMGRLCKMSISWDIEEEPSVKELMPISITVDHSVVDGAEAAEFAQLIQDKINDPESLWDSK